MAFFTEDRISLGSAPSSLGGFAACGGISVDSFASAGSSICGLYGLQSIQLDFSPLQNGEFVSRTVLQQGIQYAKPPGCISELMTAGNTEQIQSL